MAEYRSEPRLIMISADQEVETITQNGPKERKFLNLALILAEWKLFILKFVAVVTVGVIITVLIWPVSYTANSRVMPPHQSQSSIASAMMGQLGQLAPLSSLAGSSLGLKNASDIYLFVLRSRSIADDVIDRFSLMKVYKAKRRFDAEEELRQNTVVSSGPEGGITIAVSDRDPQRAADIANFYVEELKKVTQTLAVTEAGRRRMFFEHEVQDANDELSRAELAMKKTQEQTGILQLDSQSKAVIEGLSGLHTQVAVKEAQVEAMRSFATPENPELVRAQSELSAMKSELVRLEAGKIGNSIADIDLRKVPEKGLQYIRSLRDVKYREAVFEAMVKQYQIARVDEAKDATIIQVLDSASRPEVKTSPKRSLIVLTSAVIAFFLACCIALFGERVRKDESLHAGLELLKFRLLSRKQQ